jgi:hypothetical protein
MYTFVYILVLAATIFCQDFFFCDYNDPKHHVSPPLKDWLQWAQGAGKLPSPEDKKCVRACVCMHSFHTPGHQLNLCPFSTHATRRSSLKNLCNTTLWHDMTHYMHRHLYNKVLEGRRRAAARRGVVREKQLAVQYTGGSLPVSRRPSTVARILLFLCFRCSLPLFSLYEIKWFTFLRHFR